jgi:hypothetical protein
MVTDVSEEPATTTFRINFEATVFFRQVNNHLHNYIVPMNLVESVNLQVRIPEILGSNFGWNTRYPDEGYSSSFPPIIPGYYLKLDDNNFHPHPFNSL